MAIHFAYVILSIGIAGKRENNGEKKESGSNGSGLHFLKKRNGERNFSLCEIFLLIYVSDLHTNASSC